MQADSQPDVTQSWGSRARVCGGSARAHAGRKEGVAGTHLEGRVETVRDRAVRESLAKAHAQGAKEDGEPDAEEAHPGVELSREHTQVSKQVSEFGTYLGDQSWRFRA